MTAGCSDRTISLALAALLSLAACAPPPAATASAAAQQSSVPLPPMAGAGDPLRATITSAAYVFGDVSRIDGRPAEAARAVARLEWMATDLPRDPYWNAATPVTARLLGQGRDQLRDRIGIPRAIPADAVARAMIDAAAALDLGDRLAGAAALAPVADGQGAAVLSRLDHLPPSEVAASATALAYSELIRLGRDTDLDE
ncbi:hypothetical protein G3576_25705 [Roseomonas stagni]|uniref:Uncharacterized protein n=1 Tax=Falsiroseomonas algicola TaxID=2716930 RepID=A0A6M1LVE4_9PROT|nr:hypothetical protein [Falsiroseomonas algicola]NGM23434.1 hypothetical protein [Falsiroseomonas algicola]